MERTGKKVTLSILAEKLGLDISSVSKALNNKLDIGEETREKVKKMASELGYRPNLLAKSLSQKKSFMLGIVVPDLSLSFYVKVLRGIFEEAYKKAYMPILLVNDEKPELEKKNLEFFASLPVDGILINVTPGNQNENLIKSIMDQGIPFVSYDRIIHGLNIHSVKIDDIQASYEITTFLISKNRKRILYLGPTSQLSVAEDRFLGYQKALSDNNIILNRCYIVECQLNEDSAYHETKKMLQKCSVPDAILCMGGLVALGAGKAILEAGYTIPEDVILSEFGDNDIVSKLGVPFISVNQSPFEIGKIAVEKLISEIKMERPPTGGETIVPFTLVHYKI